MPILLLVESPTKVKTISSYLGKDYKVLATFGHILDLPTDRLGIDIQKDFEPEYVILKGKKKVLSSILKEAKFSSQVLIATDPDREGEFIGSIIAEKIGKKKQISRIRFQEISRTSILKAVSEPDSIDSDLVDSQKTRRILDRLIGYKVSPFLWKAIGSGLSAGRVQSIALKWISEREEEIRIFVPTESWLVCARVRYGSGEKETIQFFPDTGSFASKTLASDFLDSILKKENHLRVLEIREKSGTTLPPPPFITASLQQEAFRILKFSASKTVSLAQVLYEGIDLGDGKTQGLITYMRTDSSRISPEATAALRRKIGLIYGEDAISEKTISYRARKSKGKTQDAHEAIRPVDPFLDPQSLTKIGNSKLNNDAKKLYELIWKRSIASQMKEEKWKRIRFFAEAGGAKWEGEGVFTLEPGYKKIYSVSSDLLPAWKKGEKISPESWDVVSKTTEPPQRYSEASLIARLEKEGIGRPSTFATILETLYKRNYASSEKSRIFATALGEKVNVFLQTAFPDLFREKFTAEMEKKLDSIASGEETRSKVIGDFYSFLESNLQRTNLKNISVELKQRLKSPSYGICPVCKQGQRVKKRSSKKKEYYVCSRFPECDYAEYV